MKASFFLYSFLAVLGLHFCAGLPLVAASGGHSSSRCAGLSLSRPLMLRSTGSRRAGSVVVAHGPSWSVACGILPDQGSNPCPLHWQADSQPLRHQGSPWVIVFIQADRLSFNWLILSVIKFIICTVGFKSVILLFVFHLSCMCLFSFVSFFF